VQYGYQNFLYFTENAGINELLFEAHVYIEGNRHYSIIITTTEYSLCKTVFFFFFLSWLMIKQVSILYNKLFIFLKKARAMQPIVTS